MLIKSPFHTRVLLPPNSREGNHFPRERSPFENLNKRNQKCTSVYSTMTTSVFCKSFQFTTVQAPLCCSDWGRVEFFHLKILEHLRLSALFLTCGWKFLRVKVFESYFKCLLCLQLSGLFLACGWMIFLPMIFSRYSFSFHHHLLTFQDVDLDSCQHHPFAFPPHPPSWRNLWSMLFNFNFQFWIFFAVYTNPVEETFDRC